MSTRYGGRGSPERATFEEEHDPICLLRSGIWDGKGERLKAWSHWGAVAMVRVREPCAPAV